MIISAKLVTDLYFDNRIPTEKKKSKLFFNQDMFTIDSFLKDKLGASGLHLSVLRNSCYAT